MILTEAPSSFQTPSLLEALNSECVPSGVQIGVSRFPIRAVNYRLIIVKAFHFVCKLILLWRNIVERGKLKSNDLVFIGQSNGVRGINHLLQRRFFT